MCKKMLISVVLIALSLLQATAQNRLEEHLTRLDRTIEMADNFSANHELNTGNLTGLLEDGGRSAAERFDLYGKLFDANFSYNFNSAMDALSGKTEAAEELRDKARTCEVAIDKARLYTIAGMYLEAAQAAEQIDTTCLDAAQMLDYYDFRFRFNNDFAQYAPEEFRDRMAATAGYYRGLILLSAPEESVIHKWALILDLISQGLMEVADSLACAQLAKMDPGSHEYAEMAYYEATVCREMGRTEEMLCWFANSAMADIRSATKDNASLQSLAQELLGAGIEIERAFRYTQFSLNDALFFNARQQGLGPAGQLCRQVTAAQHHGNAGVAHPQLPVDTALAPGRALPQQRLHGRI